MAAAPGGDGGAWAIVVAICAVIINGAVAFGSGIWAIARSHHATDEKIAAKDEAMTQDLSDMERRLRGEIDDAIKYSGESVSAIRQKMTDMELWNRDNFVDKETFRSVTTDLKRWWERFEDRMSMRLDTIDKKLDRNNSPD